MSLNRFLSYEKDGLYFIGHASALIKAGKDLILCDPIWNAEPYENFIFYPKQIVCDEILSKVTGAIVSHEHADHWTPEILERLWCPVFVMGGRQRLVDRLSQHANVKEVKKQIWTTVGLESEIYFLPNPRNTVDSSCLVRRKDFCAYIGSDNFLDRNLAQDAFKASNGKIDIAALPYSFVHFYPALMDMNESKKKEEAIRLKRQALDQARMSIETMRPSSVIPFGANLFYCEGEDHPLNAYLAKPRELYLSNGMKAGDYVIKDNGKVWQYYANESDDKFPPWKPLPQMEFAVELSDIDMVSIINRVRKAPESVPENAIIVNDAVIVDCDTRRVYDGSKNAILKDRKIHKFYFDKKVFYDWAAGKITFETALGTRRFHYSREPDEYSLKLMEFMSNYL
jgi:L-ascorbate metabolism protein UlaG (beta-lactamase superfamily)